MGELNKLKIGQAAEGLREGKFSSEELLDDCLAAVKEKDGAINSFITVDEEGARASARAIDAKLKAGEKLPILAGIPGNIKDLLYTKGVKTTCASPFLKDFVPPYDATAVKMLKENGMVMVGKTNLDEFACGGSTEYSCYGVTRNPHDLERVAGGSSGGSAASVAADMSFYSVGTDTGGSIRLPAAFCGVYGMKVTYGRVSRSGVNAMASSWDTVGPFARCTEDIAHVMQAIAGHDERDMTMPKVEVPDYLSFLNSEVKGLKIGLPKEYFAEGVDKEVAQNVKEAVAKLEKAGAEVMEVSLPMTKYAVAVYYVTMPAELSANLERFDGIRYGNKSSGNPEDLVDYYFKARGEGFGAEVKRRIMVGTYVLSAGYFDAYYKKALKVRNLICQDFDKAFEQVDVLIGPVAPMAAFKVGELINDPLAMYLADALTIPVNAAGLPALACPYGVNAAGLPLSLQVIAPQFEEWRCLRVASALEKL